MHTYGADYRVVMVGDAAEYGGKYFFRGKK